MAASQIKVTDNAGNLIGRIQQVRRSGRRVWQALVKSEAGTYIPLRPFDSRVEAEDAIRVERLFGV